MSDIIFTPLPRLRYIQLKRIMRKHRYIAFRATDGTLYALNSAVALLYLNREGSNARAHSPFVSYFPIDFHTYISHKGPFL